MGKLYLSTTAILKTFETLHGLIEGISADGRIHPREIEALRYWVQDNDHLRARKPFGEIVDVIRSALMDGAITHDELEDIRYVCTKVLSTFGPSAIEGTGQIQRLHGVVSGIASDGEIHPEEWKFLSKWLRENAALKGSWPYDEIEALISKHARSEELSLVEREVITHYLNDFCGLNGNLALTHPLNEPGMAITGICAVCPEVSIVEKTFCITGESQKYQRIPVMVAK